MQLYFSPEFMKEDAQVMNIVTHNNKAVGYLAFIMDEKKVYVYGHVEEEGVSEDFKDLVKPFIEGLTKLKEDIEVFSHLSVGGKCVDMEEKKDN